MNDFNFFSHNKYIVLPTHQNPKVYLAIDNKNIKKNSFKLYNPFSLKAKILKKIAFYFSYFNVVQKNRSSFLAYLELKFNKQFVASTYIATDKDKIIVQLQVDCCIFGYVKIAISDTGNKRIQNEIFAIETLRHVNNIEIITKDIFEGFVFFITKEINGHIDFIEEDEIMRLLEKLKRDKYYVFTEHPRVKEIFEALQTLKLEKYLTIFNRLTINEELRLVYEHGDFTPWNIMSQNDQYIMFDFEYFVQNGIEYFDLIKYNYQIADLIDKCSNLDLIDRVIKNIDSENNIEIFILYLLKEIVSKVHEGKDISKEDALLAILEQKI
ncbi:MAG: hypothetical protein PHO27_10135 [Sulfuricurvum sp.]|nr:hypothetical protein [Sulfuricurvum sp.]